MNDIFLSYANEDGERAHRLAKALEDRGFTVWWDREIPPGKTFDQVIEAELNAARCVVVLWSQYSIRSRWVKTEAAAAAERDCLVPILIDEVPIPFEFKRIQAARLVEWNAQLEPSEFESVVEAIQDILKRPASFVPSTPSIPKPQVTYKKERSRWFPAIGFIAAAFLGVALLQQYLKEKAAPVPDSTVNTEAVPAAGPVSEERPVAAEVNSSDTASPATPVANAPEEAFQIRIGDRISDGKPGPGAGSIDEPFSEDVYVFSAAPRQNVYFRMIEHSQGMSYIAWQLTDENGMEVFKQCLGCGDPGVQTLIRGGKYTLKVGNEVDRGTGIYSIQLFNVPAPDQFAMKSGGVIRDGVPGRGAGVIETPGAEDVYTFTAPPRQKVHFRVLEQGTGMAYINWRLADENGMELFSQCLGCGDPGVVTMVNGGTYTLTIGNRRIPATGTYAVEYMPQ